MPMGSAHSKRSMNSSLFVPNCGARLVTYKTASIKPTAIMTPYHLMLKSNEPMEKDSASVFSVKVFSKDRGIRWYESCCAETRHILSGGIFPIISAAGAFCKSRWKHTCCRSPAHKEWQPDLAVTAGMAPQGAPRLDEIAGKRRKSALDFYKKIMYSISCCKAHGFTESEDSL